MSETKSKTKIIDRKGNYCKTENGDVYRVKVGIFGDDFGFIGNTDKSLSIFIRGMVQ